ncbi:hypothetical protein I4U23_021786 [Adineta vaga]|nr:hypothetical protein I4U23_021786 [Adineta vaga]
MKYLCGYIFLHLILAFPQINLDLTDENNSFFQHNCLHVVAWIEKDSDPYEIISYCMSENQSEWMNIQINNTDKNFTFDQLFHLNITSQQLYYWSAPFNVMERYQLYVNERLTTNIVLSSIEKQIFYNCTSPRFGPLCQYSFDNYKLNDLTLNKFIYDYYQYEYNPKTLTCYIHLQCHRFSIFACLDWSEICDGIIHCENGIDEEFCLELEINQCEDNEYRCQNGQCINEIYLYDQQNQYECLDRSDEHLYTQYSREEFIGEPTFANEDIRCTWNYPSDIKLTSSCVPKRDYLLKQFLFFDKPNNFTDDCWNAFKCYLKIPDPFNPFCIEFCFEKSCRERINESCPEMINIPVKPILFGHIYFIYHKERTINHLSGVIPPDYICYNDQLCGGFHLNRTLLSIDNHTCRLAKDFPVKYSLMGFGRDKWLSSFVVPLSKQLSQCNTILYNNLTICNNSNLYQCQNSTKCISKYRLCDHIRDCDYNDDEQCSLFSNICSNNSSQCSNESLIIESLRKHISFQIICDGFTELFPILINNERNETDETECEQWPCNNSYTRCDGFWNCFNGADEINCQSSSSLLLNCSFNNHICVSSKTNQFICLSLEQADNGIIDCLGGTDEPRLCRANDHQLTKKNFYCNNDQNHLCILSNSLCYFNQCQNQSDQQVCNQNRNITLYTGICYEEYDTIRSKIENYFCKRQIDTNKRKIIYFSLENIKHNSIKSDKNLLISHSFNHLHEHRCHRGLPLTIWLNSKTNLQKQTCLCPPSYYGNECQYQNDRISLTLQFQTYSDSRQTLFSIVILLIDNTTEQLIHSYQQFTYLYIRDCQRKFNIYLLYLTRPKDFKKSYSIQIHIYEKILLKYRNSFLIPIQFTFLPVQRLAIQLIIPRQNDPMKTCSNQNCIHGQCFKYTNNQNKDLSFCYCQQGWSGKYCHIFSNCTCSKDSLCRGILSNNQSLCICSNLKWGSQCLFQSTICQSNCYNNNQCLSSDEHLISFKKFQCICQEGFTGNQCEIINNKIIILFDQNIILSQTILIYFVEIIQNNLPEIGTTFQTIPLYQNQIIIHWSNRFHIIFVKLFPNDYYLLLIQKFYNQSEIIKKSVQLSNRCPHINEILNKIIIEYPLIRRIKYYHIPCQQNFSCFYDENYFCLCETYGKERHANCFEFNLTRKFDCFGQNHCENGGECLQDKMICPQTSMCLCQTCFHGRRCEFNSQGFSLSLDAILGYHIQPNIHLIYQSFIIKLTFILTIIMTIIGFLNSILLIITFKNKDICKNGSIIYIKISSITSLIIIILFLLKFLILIFTQIKYLTNELFLQFQCIFIDFLLKIFLNINQWLNSCVAIERTIIIIKGIYFNNKQSKQIAKYVIICLFIINILTNIQDPFHRYLFKDDNDDNNQEKRIWCIVTYSSSILEIFNKIINIFHFLIPFIINFISAPIIILISTQQRSIVQTQQTYRTILYEQFHIHQHLLITPIAFVILALPRLIISFLSGCMKSIHNPWLYLCAYFISFLPSMLTFIVFVLPSTSYKQEFRKIYQTYKITIQNRLNFILQIFE